MGFKSDIAWAATLMTGFGLNRAEQAEIKEKAKIVFITLIQFKLGFFFPSIWS
jgi:hypothetical protein